MKATVFAVVLSFCSLSLPAYALTKEPPLAADQLKPHINLNQADASILAQSFKGIGKKRANAIVAYRESHGGFKSVAELANVRGVGNAFVKGHLNQLQDVFVVK